MNQEIPPEIWLLHVAVLLTLAKVFEALITKVYLPKVLGYVFAGLIISTIGFSFDPVSKALATLGIMLLLFHAGLGEHLREFMRELKISGIVAIGGVVGALLSGFIVGIIMGFDAKEMLALGVAYAATSVSLTLKTLEDLGKLSSIEGRIIVGAAVVDDVIGLALLGATFGILSGSFDPITVVGTASIAFAFWFAVAYSFERVSKYLLRVEYAFGIEEGTLITSFIVLLILAYLALYIKLSAILLAYALGLGLSSYPYVGRRISSKIYPIVAIFMPLFFVYAGALVNPREIIFSSSLKDLWIIIMVTLFGFISKVGGCFTASRLLGLNSRKALIIGFGMVPRAEVMLVAAATALELNALHRSTYLGLLLLALTSSILIPIIIRILYSTRK